MSSVEQQTFFNKRNGEGVHDDIRIILDTPEIYLSDNEKEELREFAGGLMEGKAEGVGVRTSESLENIFRRSLDKTQESFYPAYFESEEGARDKEALGDAGTQAIFDIPHMNEVFSLKQRKEIAARSKDWYKDRIAEGLIDTAENDSNWADLPEVTISYDPDALLTKFDDLQQYRQFYRQVKARVKEESQYEGRLNKAKDIAVNRYMRRVNELVAELYPSVFSLAEQLQTNTDDPRVPEWKERLASIAPVVTHLYDSHVAASLDGALNNAPFDSFSKQLDNFRNGVDLREGEFTPISKDLTTYVERVVTTHEAHPSLLDETLIQELDGIEMDAEALSRLTTGVLHRWNLLSKDIATWEEVSERSGTAEDGLFQVIITPATKSLAVDSVKRVVKVPASFRRSATQASPAGGILVAAHELTHVQQAVFDTKLGEQIPLARIKGRQYVTLREAGGKYQERKILEDYLGREYSPNLHYLRALQEKLSGGNVVQVARAFYNSYVAQNTPTTEARDKAARELAADRVLRLYRYGGHNSQPLDYIEQELIVDQLSSMSEQERSAFLLAAGSFNMHDLAMLRSAGALEIPKTVDCNPAADTIEVFMRDLYPQYHTDKTAS